jgi:hypothetical protein
MRKSLVVIVAKFLIIGLCFVMPCSLIGGYQRFGGTCCLHLQGEPVMIAGSRFQSGNSLIEARLLTTRPRLLVVEFFDTEIVNSKDVSRGCLKGIVFFRGGMGNTDTEAL